MGHGPSRLTSITLHKYYSAFPIVAEDPRRTQEIMSAFRIKCLNLTEPRTFPSIILFVLSASRDGHGRGPAGQSSVVLWAAKGDTAAAAPCDAGGPLRIRQAAGSSAGEHAPKAEPASSVKAGGLATARGHLVAFLAATATAAGSGRGADPPGGSRARSIRAARMPRSGRPLERHDVEEEAFLRLHARLVADRRYVDTARLIGER